MDLSPEDEAKMDREIEELRAKRVAVIHYKLTC